MCIRDRSNNADINLDQLRSAYEEGGKEGFMAAATKVRKDNLNQHFTEETDASLLPGPATANIEAYNESSDPKDLSSKTDPPLKMPILAS